jgi:crotonobetainyl-CoA:carnitine CoA-transferase CaiB-like acyl-CoA transferase
MLPLEGITIVSLEQAVAAPFATRQLADLGARVIKIERPGVGDFSARSCSNSPRLRPIPASTATPSGLPTAWRCMR